MGTKHNILFVYMLMLKENAVVIVIDYENVPKLFTVPNAVDRNESEFTKYTVHTTDNPHLNVNSLHKK